MKMRYALPLAYGAALLGVGIWAAVDPKGMMTKTRKGRKKIESATGARLPRPDVILLGPNDEETFDSFDEILCESALEVHTEDPTLLDDSQDAFVDAVALLTLTKLFPEYPWPTTSGDHPSAAEVQGFVKYEVIRSILDKTLCIDTGDALADADEQDQINDFIPPPGE